MLTDTNQQRIIVVHNDGYLWVNLLQTQTNKCVRNMQTILIQVSKANSLSDEEVKGLLQLGKITRVNIKKTKKVPTEEDNDLDNIITLE